VDIHRSSTLRQADDNHVDLQHIDRITRPMKANGLQSLHQLN
jgi:hypothetical protein